MIEALDGTLRPVGFRRRRNAWNRASGTFVDVVDIQTSKSLTHAWVNLGVADPEIFRRTWETALPEFVVEGNCTVRERLGILVNGHDDFWEFTDRAAPADIQDKMMRHGLPFLDALHSREALLDNLRSRPPLPPEVFYRAHLHIALGRRDMACQELANYATKGRGAWVEYARKMLDQVGCPPGTAPA
jgi:hypothetical protein